MAAQPHGEPPAVTDKLPLEQAHLEALERMRLLEPYYRWTLQLFQPYLGQRVMDAGCGIGNFTAVLADNVAYTLAVDLSPLNIAVLKARFTARAAVEVAQLDLERDIAALTQKRLDTIVCLDVLEHLEDDLGLLRSFRQVIQPGGYLCLKVPACPWLYGSVDVASSHYRRYTLRELAQKATQTGWTPVQVRYTNIFGVLPYWLKSRVLKRSANFSRTFAPWQLHLLQRTMPILQVIDRLIGPPIGQSAILIAQ